MGKITLGFLALFSLTSIYAGVCDATYSFQKAFLYEGKGDHVENLTFTETEIGPDLQIPYFRSPVDTLPPNPMHYRFPLEFESQCPLFNAYPTGPSWAHMLVRDSGTTVFKRADDEERWIRHVASQPFSNGPTIKNIMLMYADTLKNTVDYVIEDSTDGVYKATYGAAIYYDTLMLNGAPVGHGHGSFAWGVRFDTTAFMEGLRGSSLNSVPEDNPGWTENPDYTSFRDFRVQMLVVHYDTSGGAVSTDTKPVQQVSPGVEIRQTPNGYEITLPESTLPFFPTAEIYNIKGERIKQLSIVNNKYVWDGSTHSGQAQRGIYFLRINQKTHKLFYEPRF